MRIMHVVLSFLSTPVHAVVEPGAADPLSVSVEQAGSPPLQVGGHFAVDDVPLDAAAGCKKIVYCRGGKAYSAMLDYSKTDADITSTPLGTTCAEECAGNCCVGNKACSVGHFAVCADPGDGSCNGDHACYAVGGTYLGLASGLISGGSCVGSWAACMNAGEEGVIGNISGGSCVGDKACEHAGKRGGEVGDISDKSCVGDKACFAVGAASGDLGNISDSSCVGDRACIGLGASGGSMGDVSGSCKGDEACQKLFPKDKMSMVILHNCCNGKRRCRKVDNWTKFLGLEVPGNCRFV